MSVGADKAYDTREFVATLREMDIRPHVAQNVQRSGGSAIDRRTSRHASYAVSQSKRPLIEKVFGWMKQTGGMRQTKLRGLAKVAWQWHGRTDPTGASDGIPLTSPKTTVYRVCP